MPLNECSQFGRGESFELHFRKFPTRAAEKKFGCHPIAYADQVTEQELERTKNSRNMLNKHTRICHVGIQIM